MQRLTPDSRRTGSNVDDQSQITLLNCRASRITGPTCRPTRSVPPAVANTRSIAMQAYLHAFPAFLHMRQLTEFIQGRQYMAPGENPLGGWFLMRKLADTTTTTVSPNVDTLYGATYVFLDQQGPMVLSVPRHPRPLLFGRAAGCLLQQLCHHQPAHLWERAAVNYLLVPARLAGEAPEGIKDVLIGAHADHQPVPAHLYPQRGRVSAAARTAGRHPPDPAGAVGRGSRSRFPPADLSPYAIQGMRMTRDPLKFFEYTNFYTGVNPPPAEDAGLMALFKTAGVGPGAQLPDDPHLRQAIAQGAADAQAAINARITAGPFRDGWTVPDPRSAAPARTSSAGPPAS